MMSQCMKFADDECQTLSETMSSPVSYSSTGTGYLEDVVFHLSSKRQRRLLDDCASSHDTSSIKQDFDTTKCGTSSGDNEKRKKRLLAKVLCPFALVKPGGFEGDITLEDINERILMPPTRPVRHPVGDFACRPLVSPDGPGLSGKAVVAFTRIQTRGRGTITIVRTRG